MQNSFKHSWQPLTLWSPKEQKISLKECFTSDQLVCAGVVKSNTFIFQPQFLVSFATVFVCQALLALLAPHWGKPSGAGRPRTFHLATITLDTHQRHVKMQIQLEIQIVRKNASKKTLCGVCSLVASSALSKQYFAQQLLLQEPSHPFRYYWVLQMRSRGLNGYDVAEAFLERGI